MQYSLCTLTVNTLGSQPSIYCKGGFKTGVHPKLPNVSKLAENREQISRIWGYLTLCSVPDLSRRSSKTFLALSDLPRVPK